MDALLLTDTGLTSWFTAVAGPARRYGRTFFRVRRAAKRRAPDGQRAPACQPADRQRSGGRWFVTAAVLVTLAGAGLRASFLNHPMRYDESMVYFEYVIHPLHDLATRYDRVQNHLLHTILEHAATRLGGHSPPVLRLAAVVAGTALIPLAIALAYAVTRRGIYGLLAGGFVAASSVLLDYSTNARGYTMVCAFTLGMCLCTLGLMRRPARRRLWPTWAVLAALGAFTVPTMLFPVVGLAAVLAFDAVLNRRPRRRRVQLVRLAVTLGTWALLTTVLYLPAVVRTGVPTVLATSHAVQHYAEHFFASPYQVVRLTWQDWARDAATPALILGGFGLALGFVRALRTRSPAWAMPWGMLLGGAVVAAVLPVQPYPRVWLYLLPVALTFSVCGLALIEPRPLRRLAVTVMVASVLVGGYRASRREFLVAEDPHTLVDAGLVAKACAEWPSREFALLTLPATEAVRYYAHLWNLPRPAHPINGHVRAAYVVVNHTQSLEDVLAAKGGSWLRAYGPPRLYKTLPHCRIYRMNRADQQLTIVDYGFRIEPSRRSVFRLSIVDCHDGGAWSRTLVVRRRPSRSNVTSTTSPTW